MEKTPIQVLVVDDSEDDLVLIDEALEEEPRIKVIAQARDGEEALAYLRGEAQQEPAKRPDMVLLDINMPRKNGFDVLQEIRDDPRLRSTPVVMLTTSEREEDVIRSFELGARSYVPKPLDLGGLRRMATLLAEYWTTVSRLPRK